MVEEVGKSFTSSREARGTRSINEQVAFYIYTLANLNKKKVLTINGIHI